MRCFFLLLRINLSAGLQGSARSAWSEKPVSQNIKNSHRNFFEPNVRNEEKRIFLVKKIGRFILQKKPGQLYKAGSTVEGSIMKENRLLCEKNTLSFQQENNDPLAGSMSYSASAITSRTSGIMRFIMPSIPAFRVIIEEGQPEQEPWSIRVSLPCA